MSKSTDYHDYVFRDGKLVGEFEEMYRNSATMPWHQDEQENWIDVRLTKEILRDLTNFDEIHDFGCGTGHYLNLIANHKLAPNGKTYGYDISQTACERAASFFPQSRFTVFDLTKKVTNSGQLTIDNKKSARLFMIRGTLWYVFPKIANVIENIAKRMMYQDRLLVVQNFPPLDSKFIGKEVLPNHSALLLHFSSHFCVETHMWYENQMKATNDNWFIGIFSLKDRK